MSRWDVKYREPDVHDAARVRVTITEGGWRTTGGMIVFVASAEPQTDTIPWADVKRNDRPAWVASQLAAVTKKHNVEGWVVDKVTGWLVDVPLDHSKSIKWRRKSVYTLCTEIIYSSDGSKCCARPVYEDGVDLCGSHNKRYAKEAAIEAQRAIQAQEAQRRMNERLAAHEAKVKAINDRYNAMCTHLGLQGGDLKMGRSYTSDVYLTTDKMMAIVDAIIGPVQEIVEPTPILEPAPIIAATSTEPQAGIVSPFD